MPIKVFYDGQCGLCLKEINYYRRKDKVHEFEWVDITSNSEALSAAKLERDNALLYLHVQDENGQWHIGVDAFIQIWRNIPGWHWAAKLTAIPLVKGIMEKFYTVFAHRRFKKMGYCATKT